MALPSIVLLVIFVGAVFLGVMSLLGAGGWFAASRPAQTMLAALAAVVAAVLHWLRFHVPITVAAGVAALAGDRVGAVPNGGAALLSITRWRCSCRWGLPSSRWPCGSTPPT